MDSITPPLQSKLWVILPPAISLFENVPEDNSELLSDGLRLHGIPEATRHIVNFILKNIIKYLKYALLRLKTKEIF